jgi:carbon monoxide dehydrogenase subunit G
MNITQDFSVNKPIDTVWEFFQDIKQVAACLPGAELLEDRGDGSYTGKVEAKLGPMTATFEGEATVTPDATNKTGHIEGKGADRRGGSRGQVKVDYTMTEADGATLVNVNADVTLSGSAAQFGRTGLIKELSGRLVGEFIECLEAKLGAATVEESIAIEADEVKGFSLFLLSLFAPIVRLFKKIFGRG